MEKERCDRGGGVGMINCMEYNMLGKQNIILSLLIMQESPMLISIMI